MKYAIVGSRTFNDYQFLKDTLDQYDDINLIVSGGAYGADKLAERYAKEHGIDTKIFIPEWSKYGKSAGYKRNRLIIGYSDIVIAFWDGVSKGTKHDIDIADELNIKCIIRRFK